MTAADGPLLVLGASGRLGRLMRAAWRAPQGDVIWHSRRLGADVCFDPLEDAAVAEAALGSRAVLCLAGVTPAHVARTGDDMTLNTDLALAAIRGAAVAGVSRVFLASSAAVYGGGAGVLDEGFDCAPQSDYGRSKLEMEIAGLALGAALGVRVCTLRIGNVAGADAILAGWHPGFALDQYPDGQTPTRSYIGPVSLAHVFDALSHARDLPLRINIAAGTVAMGDLLDAAGLEWVARPATAKTIARVALDITRLTGIVTLDPDADTAQRLVSEWRQVRAAAESLK